jgi:hypothetical protein
MRFSADARIAAEVSSCLDYRCCFFHELIISQNIIKSDPTKSEYFVAVYDTRIRKINTKKIVSTLVYAHHLN